MDSHYEMIAAQFDKNKRVYADRVSIFIRARELRIGLMGVVDLGPR